MPDLPQVYQERDQDLQDLSLSPPIPPIYGTTRFFEILHTMSFFDLLANGGLGYTARVAIVCFAFFAAPLSFF